MQFSKRLSNAAVTASPQGRAEISGKVLSLGREAIRASVRVEPGVIKMLEDCTRHGRATPLLWLTVDKDELKDQRNDFEDLC